jgi:hypothetical protein
MANSPRQERNDEIDAFVLDAVKLFQLASRHALSKIKEKLGFGKNLWYDELDSSLLRLIADGKIESGRDQSGVMRFFPT